MEVYSVKTNGNQVPRAGFSASQGSKEAHLAEPKKTAMPETVKAPKEDSQKDFPKMVEIAHHVREKLKEAGVNIQFEINREIGRIVIKVLDPVTGEVVRKIPPENLVRQFEYLNESMKTHGMQGIELDVKY